MAGQLLIRSSRTAALLAGSLLLMACPHDWATFESVPREERDAGGDTATDPSSPVLTPGPGPATFAQLDEHPTLVAAEADGLVFLTTEGSVLGCSHDGCSPYVRLASGQHDVRSLAIGHGFVAWAARGDQAVRRISRAPSPSAIEQVDADDGLVAVALSPTKVYFAVDAVGVPFGAPGIRSCSPGVDCHDIILGSLAEGRATELAVVGSDAFWLGESAVVGCAIASCESDVANRVPIAEEPVYPNALAVDAARVYWASPTDGGSIRTAPRASLGGTVAAPHALATNVGNVSRIAVTTRSVWMIDTAAGRVSRTPIAGGPTDIVATGLAAPAGISAGGGKVYVTCSGDGRIVTWSDE